MKQCRGAFVVAVSLFLFAGCSQEEIPDEADGGQRLPEELMALQGSWLAASTNGCTLTCSVIIDGQAVRIRYQEAPDAIVVRESALIEQIDPKKHLLILGGGTGAWEYAYDDENGIELLELEFYSRSIDGGWRRMHLMRGAYGSPAQRQ